MVTARMLLIGVVVFFVGVQLRLVDTFVLNEQATLFLEKHASPRWVQSTGTTAVDPYQNNPTPYADGYVARKSVSPPRWLGWSFLSVGAVLILTSPCFRA
jgi:hypothetical protein